MIHTIQRIAQCTIGIVFFVLAIVNWRYNHIGQNILNLLATSIFFAGLDNIIILYRCYLEEPSYEMEATFIIFNLFILGLLFQAFNVSPSSKMAFNQICFYLIVIVLFTNFLYFAGMMFLIIGYFIRHIYRLMTNRLINPEQALDPNRLQNLLNQEKSFEQISHEYNNINSGCSICFDEFDKDTLCIILPECEHVFHRDCIEEWLRDHPTCPYCRNNIILSTL